MFINSSVLTGGTTFSFLAPTVAPATPPQFVATPPASAEEVIRGWAYSHAKRSIINLVDRMMAGEDHDLLARVARMDSDKIVSIYNSQPDLWDEISRLAIQGDPILRPTAAGGFLYLALDHDREALVEFWRQVATGVNIPKTTSPALLLRSDLIADRPEMNRVKQMRKCLIAFRAHVAGKPAERDFADVPTISILTVK